MSSLSSFSASNDFGKGHLFIVFKMYFDGSGKDDGLAPRLTLAGYAAKTVHWDTFDEEWNAILLNHPLKPSYFHTNEAIHLRGEFTKKRGWTIEGVIKLARSLNQFLHTLPRKDFCCFRFTVDMQAYRAWRKLANLRPASQQCALEAFLYAFKWCSNTDVLILNNIDVVYDRSEGFLGHMYARWTSKKMRQRFPELHLVNTIASADAKKTPALQAADMLAWSANRLWIGPRHQDIDSLCEDLLAHGLSGWHGEYDAEHLQDRRGLIKIPGRLSPEREQNPVAYIVEHRKP